MILYYIIFSLDPLDVKEVLEKYRHDYLYYDDNSAFRITIIEEATFGMMR